MTLNTAQMTSYSLLSLAVAWGTKTSVTRLMAASQWQGVIGQIQEAASLALSASSLPIAFLISVSSASKPKGCFNTGTSLGG